MVMGLTTGLWVMAQVRLCDRAFIPATIVRKGHDEAGTLLIEVNLLEGGVTVFAQASSLDGEPARSRGTGPQPISEAGADAYIERQEKYDPDFWVLEIDDRRGQYKLV